MNILMLGVPASGKGTQAKALTEKYNFQHVSTQDICFHHVSTGDICRDTDESTNLGRKIRTYMNKGKLIPTPLMTQLLKEHIKKLDPTCGIVLEGYPRNPKQAEIIEKFLHIDKVIYLDISDEESIKRISSRLTCENKKCDAIYNTYTAPKPKKSGVCDNCGSKLYQREDQSIEAVEKRLNIYHSETKPLITYYKDKGILIRVNGNQSIDDVHKEILKELSLGSDLLRNQN